MLNWSEINPALVSLITSLAVESPEAWRAEWRDRPLKAVDQKQKLQLTLKVTNVSAFGDDEIRYESVSESSTDPADAAFLGGLRENLTGQRKFTLQLQALTLENTDQLNAVAVLERVRTRLRRQRSINALHAIDVAHIRSGNVIDIATVKEGRVVPRASLDLTLGACFNDSDTVPAGWFNRIELTSHLQDTDGTELPVPPNVTDLVIPTPAP